MNCTYTRSIGTTPYMIVFNRKPTYRRIPLYSRPGCEIQDELLDEAAAPGTVDEDEALKNFIHEQYTEVTDAEFEEIDRAMRQKMADQQFQRRLANDLAKTSEDAGPSKDISEDAGPSKDALGKEQAKQVEGIPDSDDDNDSSLPNSGLPSSGNDDSDHGSDQQLQQLQKKVTGDTSQLPIKVPSHTGHTDSEWTDSELDAIEAEIAANRAARRKEDTSANGHKGPSTPPKDRANESDSGTDDMLSPSLGALRLGNRGNRSGIHELDSTPTTAARIGVKEFQQRAQARSIKQYGKQRRVQVYEIGQNVSVAIPREDRSSTDDKRLFGKVIMSFPEMNQYEVVTQWGVLDRYCPISIVNPVEDAVDVGVPEPPPRNKVSIAHCAGQQSMSQKVLVKCDCRDRKTWCSKRTCRCIKAEVKCSVHCHQSQGHPDTRIECPNVAPAHEWTRMGLGTREQQREQEQVEKRARKDAAGNWVSTKGIGFGPVDEHGKVDERVRKELVQKKQRRRG